MKKLLCFLLATITITSFAVEKDCSGFNTDQIQDSVAAKVQAKGVKGLTINYSSDLAAQANALQSKLQAKGINITMTKVDGTAKCEFTDFSK